MQTQKNVNSCRNVRWNLQCSVSCCTWKHLQCVMCNVCPNSKVSVSLQVTLKLQGSQLPDSSQLQQYTIKCEEEDKFLLIYTLLKLQLVQGKTLLFVAAVDRSYRLKLFLEQFAIPACVLNSELPVQSRWAADAGSFLKMGWKITIERLIKSCLCSSAGATSSASLTRGFMTSSSPQMSRAWLSLPRLLQGSRRRKIAERNQQSEYRYMRLEKTCGIHVVSWIWLSVQP